MAQRAVLNVGTGVAGRRRALEARYREAVLNALGGAVERIVLFGSRARGEADADSDWDFAVFLGRAPTAEDRERLRELDRTLGRSGDAPVQSWLFPSERWLATDELTCNIRDEGAIVYGPAERPMIERPRFVHAHDALTKAERFVDQSTQAAPEHFETVIHNGYYAMFHAARAVLLATQGKASTKHGRVVETFARFARRRGDAEATGHAAILRRAFELRGEADYGSADLTEAAKEVRAQVTPFLGFARRLVEETVNGR